MKEPMGLELEPLPANLSASSLPSIPECPGTQWRARLENRGSRELRIETTPLTCKLHVMLEQMARREV